MDRDHAIEQAITEIVRAASGGAGAIITSNRNRGDGELEILVTFDRRPKRFDAEAIRKALAPLHTDERRQNPRKGLEYWSVGGQYQGSKVYLKFYGTE